MSTAAVLALFVGLFATNPGKGEYVEWLMGKVRNSAATPQSRWAALQEALNANPDPALLHKATTRHNFLVFSVFETRVGSAGALVVGIGRQFWDMIEEAEPATTPPANPTVTPPSPAVPPGSGP